MGFYIYCVVPAGYPPDRDLAGIDDAPVFVHETDGLGCWASEPAERPEPSIERIRMHHRVVEQAVTDEVTPVPVRFGQWLPSLRELEAHLAGRAELYRRMLADFAGALEFGLRVIEPGRVAVETGSVARAASGRAYLTELRQRFRADSLADPLADRVRQRFQEALLGIARAERFEPLRTAHGVLSASHLVARLDFAAYRNRVRDFRAEFPNLRFLASGPWPPYTFAT